MTDLNHLMTERAESNADVSKIAEMIASGELPIPFDWPQPRLQQLLNEVHQRRRRHLVKFIARSIAGDLGREE